MRPPPLTPEVPTSLILHILPLDIARGGQTYVRALRECLDAEDHRHRTLTLFGSAHVALHADIRLGVRAGRLRAVGFDPIAYLRLRRIIRQLRPALVVAHGGEPLKYSALACPSEVALVYHRIGISSRKLRNPIRRALYRILVSRADAVVAISDDALDELRQVLRSSSTRLLAIPNARDGTRFRPATRARSSTPRVLFLGHLVATKRPELFLEVVATLREQGLDFEAELVGDGPLRGTLESQAAASGVRMLGRRDDVPALLREADLMVFTSVAEGEGLPGVLIEAGLAGLPVVSTDVPGARTAIVHDETGFVVGVEDKDGLTSYVQRLLSDPELRALMGTAARTHCLKTLSIESSGSKWRQLIEEMILARSVAAKG